MVKQVFIHIGLSKTATTFLQNEVFTLIPDINYLHPEFLRTNHSFQKLINADSSWYDKREIQATVEQIYAHKSSKLLLSYEVFSGTDLNDRQLDRGLIALRLKEIFPNAHIILVIRGQQSIIYSTYNQWIKGHRKYFKKIENFIGKPGLNYTYSMYLEDGEKYQNNFNKFRSIQNKYWYFDPYKCTYLDYFKYFSLIQTYKTMFNNVSVLLYEDLRENFSDFLNQLEVIIGESIGSDQILNRLVSNDSDLRVNSGLESIQLQEQLFKNKLNIFTNKTKIINILTKIYRLYRNVKPIHKNNTEKEYIRELIKGYYRADNNTIVANYPEIKLGNYPNDYEL